MSKLDKINKAADSVTMVATGITVVTKAILFLRDRKTKKGKK